MKKPYGVEEWDGYPMPEVPKDRKPLTKEEEKRIGEELRANILRDVEFVIDDDNKQYCEKNRKIG